MDCGDCHICCRFDGEYCQNCDPSKQKGCKVYDKRPEDCRNYVCMWKQMNSVDVEIRPDISHIMFDKISENIVCGTQDDTKPMSASAERQIISFVRQGFSVGIINGHNKQIALAQGHTMPVVAKTIEDFSQRMMEKHNGSC